MNDFSPAWRKFLHESSLDTDEVAKIVMIDPQGKILLLKRKKDQKFGGKWDLPGGHLKTGESSSAGLHREVEEETNLVVSDEQLIKKKGRYSFYKSQAWSGTIFTNEQLPEHVESRWFNREEIESLGEELASEYRNAIQEAV